MEQIESSFNLPSFQCLKLSGSKLEELCEDVRQELNETQEKWSSQ